MDATVVLLMSLMYFCFRCLFIFWPNEVWELAVNISLYQLPPFFFFENWGISVLAASLDVFKPITREKYLMGYK